MDRRPVLTAVALAATVVLVSCGKKEDAPAAAAPGAQPAATAQAPAAQGSIVADFKIANLRRTSDSLAIEHTLSGTTVSNQNLIRPGNRFYCPFNIFFFIKSIYYNRNFCHT